MVAIMIIYIHVGRELWRRNQSLHEAQKSNPSQTSAANTGVHTNTVSAGKPYFHNYHPGSFLDDDSRLTSSVSIDKSKFVSTKDVAKHTNLNKTKRTIFFIVRLTNNTGSNIQAGNISIAFQNHGQYIADPVTASFDLASGVSKLITIAWKPSIEIESFSCMVITTVYDAANDQLGTLSEPLNID